MRHQFNLQGATPLGLPAPEGVFMCRITNRTDGKTAEKDREGKDKLSWDCMNMVLSIDPSEKVAGRFKTTVVYPNDKNDAKGFWRDNWATLFMSATGKPLEAFTGPAGFNVDPVTMPQLANGVVYISNLIEGKSDRPNSRMISKDAYLDHKNAEKATGGGAHDAMGGAKVTQPPTQGQVAQQVTQPAQQQVTQPAQQQQVTQPAGDVFSGGGGDGIPDVFGAL